VSANGANVLGAAHRYTQVQVHKHIVIEQVGDKSTFGLKMEVVEVIPLSFTSLFISTMQLILGSPLIFSLSTSVLHSTQLITAFCLVVLLTSSFSIVSFSHNWIKSYLSNRCFSVTSGSSSSFILPSSCGVPQGSLLGPTLFTIIIIIIIIIISTQIK